MTKTRNDRRVKGNDQQRGFTLVELLVSIALFSILVAIAMGGFVNAIHTEHQVAAMMSAESNVSIAIEEMMREIRTGSQFCHDVGVGATANPACGCAPQVAGVTWTCKSLIYKNASGNTVTYSLVGGVLNRDGGDGNGPQPITATGVTITNLGFTLFGNEEGDHWTPRVTIAISVEPNDSTVQWSTANLETSVSARGIDCTQGATPNC